tara:strand:+ start:1811 stop:2620 length:810 start_codon:yes stop_codon:yes gene_type:complete
MFNNINTIQLVTNNNDLVCNQWQKLLSAQKVSQDTVDTLNAKRTILYAGNAKVELLEQLGDGEVAKFLSSNPRGGLFSVGLSTTNLEKFTASLDSKNISYITEKEQIYIDETLTTEGGLRVVVSTFEKNEISGLLNRFFEVSYLVSSPDTISSELATKFRLNQANFDLTESKEFGFTGFHTYINDSCTDDIEVIHPLDETNTMGRFFKNKGPGLYMCFAESSNMNEIRSRANEILPGGWIGSTDENTIPESAFLHPKLLGGVMVGVKGK